MSGHWSAKIAVILILNVALGAQAAEPEPVDSVVQTPVVAFDSTATELISDSLGVASSPSHVLDTIYYIPLGVTSKASLITNPIDFEDHLSQRPTTALFKSMLIPGWGQIGNRSYFKAAIVIGLEGWLISNAVHYRRTASDKFNQFLATDDSLTSQRDALYYEFEDQRSLRNKYYWFAGLTVFISMFDAYVDAHLSGAPDRVKFSRVGFEMRPDLSGGFQASLSLAF